MEAIVAIGLGYALCYALFAGAAAPLFLWLQPAVALRPVVGWSRDTLFCLFVGVLSAIVSYPPIGLMAHYGRALSLPPAWSGALWLFGALSLFGFLIGFLCEWIAICIEQKIEEGGYRGTKAQAIINTLLLTLSLALYGFMSLSGALTNNRLVLALARTTRWLTDLPVVGWVLALLGFLFVIATLREVVGAALALWSRWSAKRSDFP